MSDLKAQIQETWISLSPRDRKAAALLAASLTIAIVIFGLILPLSSTVESSRSELVRAEETLRSLSSLAPDALALSRQGLSDSVDSSVDINTEVRRQAARYGVTLQRFEPDSDRLKVWLEDVRYPAVVQWIGSLEAQGISAVELTLEDRPNPGLVNARVTFGAGQ